MTAIAAASGVIAAYALAQDANFDPFLTRAAYVVKYWNGELTRGPATLGHAVYLGGFLAAAIPLVLGLASRTRSAIKFTFVAVAVLCFGAVILSGSRSAILALAVAAAVSLPSVRRVPRRAWLAGGFACLAAVMALLIPLRTTLNLHLDRWRTDSYGGTRLRVWQESLALAAAHPLFGSGPDTFAAEFQMRQSAEFARLYPDFIQETPHNFLLDGVISQGLSFLAVIAGLVYLLFAPSRVPINGYGRCIRAAFASTLVSLFFISITICGSLMLFVLPGWFIGAGISTPGDSRPMPPRAVKLAAWGFVGLFLFAALLFLKKDAAYADLNRAAIGHRFDEMAITYQRSVEFAFPAAGEDLWCSRRFATIARGLSPPSSAAAWSLAEEASARAERFGDERAEAAYQSALLAIGMNQAQPAVAALRRAIAWAPNWYKPHLLFAQLLHYLGLSSEAQAEAAAALDLSGDLRSTVELSLRSTQAR
jgi:hypothetical protein